MLSYFVSVCQPTIADSFKNEYLNLTCFIENVVSMKTDNIAYDTRTPGTIDGDYNEQSLFDWWGTPDTYVKAWISGDSGVTNTQDNDYTPEWGAELDMGCPSNENATLNLQLFDVSAPLPDLHKYFPLSTAAIKVECTGAACMYAVKFALSTSRTPPTRTTG